MSSNKQIEVNRLNAQRSTGPPTPAGQAKVSANALKQRSQSSMNTSDGGTDPWS
jgi:hypothetical protein